MSNSRTSTSSGPPERADRRLDRGRRNRLGRRSRRDRARRPGGATIGATRTTGSCPTDRPAIDSSATSSRSRRRSEPLDERRMELAEPAHEPDRPVGAASRARRRSGPGWSIGSSASGVHVEPAELEADREELDEPLERRRGPPLGRAGSRPRARGARRGRSPAATIPAGRRRPGRSPCRPRTAPRSARPCRTLPATTSAGSPTSPWRRTACSGESGFWTVIGSTARRRPPRRPPRRASSSRTARAGRGDTSAWVTTSSGRPRRASRGRPRGARAGSGARAAAACPGASAGSPRSRGRGRSPRSTSASMTRSRRQVGIGGHDRCACAGGHAEGLRLRRRR